MLGVEKKQEAMYDSKEKKWSGSTRYFTANRVVDQQA